MTFRDLVPATKVRGLWLHPDARAWSAGLPESGDALRGRGRGGIARARAGDLRVLVKEHRRGGLLRALLPDAFLSARGAVAEARALESLSALGLSPRCLALEIRGRFLKRLRLGVEEIEGATDLLAIAASPAAGHQAIATAAGRAIRGMHDAGVAHADLNAGNILVRREGDAWRAWIVDLDGAAMHPGGVSPERRVAQVLRLCRSIDKWSESASAGARARLALLRAALPASLVLGALRRARRAHAWRRLLGRRPRPLLDQRDAGSASDRT